MASSKSFRASIFPSSFSLSALRTSTHADNATADDSHSYSPSRSKPRRKQSFDLIRPHRQHPSSRRPSTSAVQLQQLHHASQYESDPYSYPGTETVASCPSCPISLKSRTWGDRTSSLPPSLTTSQTDVNLIQRKPVGAVKGSPTDTTTPPPPPPHYREHDPKALPTLPYEVYDAPPPERRPSTPSTNNYSNFHLSSSVPILQTEVPPSALGIDQNPRTSSLIKSPFESTHHQTMKSEQESDAAGGRQRRDSVDTSTLPKKLRKSSAESKRPRSNSYQVSPAGTPQLGVRSSQTMTLSERKGRSVSSHPLLSVTDPAGTPSLPPPQPASRGSSPRSNASNSQSPTRGRVRRSWMPGGRSRSNSGEVGQKHAMQAWVMTEESTSEYNTTFLKNGEKVPELWNENGAVLVYLYPRSSGAGPCFKVPEFTIVSSYIFNELIASEQDSAADRHKSRSFGGRDSLSVDDAVHGGSPPVSPHSDEHPNDLRLYLPASKPSATTHLAAPGQGSDEELDRLVAIRNLFAFLTGQPLVGTKSRPTVFAAFLEVAELLEEYGFIGVDGSGFGNAVDMSFGFYCDFLGLADCRHSREKTIEALILGERMRSVDLYNEAFAHAAGKYSAILDLKLPTFEKISPQTRQRLERAHIDLVHRQHNVNEHLEQFEFPSIFAGIANSTSIAELKAVRFKIWRNSFSRMRQFILGYYKTAFGSWPPKASSKKNPFAESGLNRLVLKLLYSDICALYDLLVDRTDLTSRVIDHIPELSESSDKMLKSALRNVMSEFDRSKPPVLPPIPFDLPQLPTVASIHETYSSLSAKEQAKFDKRIKEHELLLILNKSYNYDTNTINLPFLEQFKDFEAREAKGKMAQDLVDQRIGYWLFLYSVLQSLPMLVVDAPGLKFTEGTEYFLCEPPIGQPPWAEDRQVRKMWYEVAGGGGIVELSADAVMFSVEATYHRSHCWLAAKKWEGIDDAETPPPEEPAMSPLQPPRPNFQGADGVVGTPPPAVPTPSPPPGSGTPQLAIRPRNLSPAGQRRVSSAVRSSMVMGLEPVPMEPPNMFGVHQRSSSLGWRPPSSHPGLRSASSGNLAGLAAATPQMTTPAPAATSGTTFDDILGEPEKKKKPAPKKKGRFF